MATGLSTISEQSLSVRNATELIPAIEKYGAMIAKGGLFGCKNAEQGQTLVLMSMSEGIPVTEMKRRYHIINGSDLSMRADYMLAEFERLGGWWDWINQGDDGLEAVLHVKFKHHDKQVVYTMEMAKKAGLIKPKGGWGKNPGEMLRARVQTKAIRMVCPGVLAGFATDQELDPDADATEGEYQVDKNLDRAVSPAEEAGTSAATTPASGPEVDPAIDDAEFSPVTTDERASGAQMRELMDLFGTLELDSLTQSKAFQSTGASSMGDLTPAGAEEIIGKLRSYLPVDREPIVAESVAPASCSPAQAAVLKSLIQVLAQEVGGVASVQRLKAHMDSSGLAKFAELNTDEADALIAAFESKDFSQIYAEPFAGVSKKD